MLVECLVIKETQRGYSRADRTGCQFLFHCQVDLVRANLLRTEHFWRSAEVPCKHRNLVHVGGLGRRCQIPHRHVLNQHAESGKMPSRVLMNDPQWRRYSDSALAILSVIRHFSRIVSLYKVLRNFRSWSSARNRRTFSFSGVVLARAASLRARLASR